MFLFSEKLAFQAFPIIPIFYPKIYIELQILCNLLSLFPFCSEIPFRQAASTKHFPRSLSVNYIIFGFNSNFYFVLKFYKNFKWRLIDLKLTTQVHRSLQLQISFRQYRINKTVFRSLRPCVCTFSNNHPPPPPTPINN